MPQTMSSCIKRCLGIGSWNAVRNRSIYPVNRYGFNNSKNSIGINATAVATLNGGSISTVFVTNAGAGYTEPPTVTFAGGGGTGAAATATISDGVLRVITL